MKILMTVANPFVHDLRVFYEASALISKGHEVTVIAWDPLGKHEKSEISDGIKIQRIRNHFLARLMRRKPLQLPFFWRAAYQWARHQNFDAIHCHDLDTLAIGLKLKSRRNLKLVYDAHEIYTWLIQRDLTKIFTPFYNRLEKNAARQVDHLIIADEMYASYFSRQGYPKMSTVLNTKPILTENYVPPENSVFTLLYIGTLTHARFLLELVEVVTKLQDIKLIIAGIGPLATKLKQRCAPVPHISFLGPVPADNVLPMTKAADVVVCMIDPADHNNRIASANKQFEAMVCGRPIIATQGTRSGEITTEENCGLVVEFSRSALKTAILTLKNDPDLRERLGKNALDAAINRYNWERDSQKLLNIYSE